MINSTIFTIISCSNYSLNTKNWELIIAIVALIIAIVTILITSRYQILTFIHAQLIEIAKNCNSYLQDDYQVHKDGKIKQGRASGIVTALEDAEKIINQYVNERFLIYKKDEPKLKKLFYNHLHSSIKVVLKDYLILKNQGFNYEKPDKYDPVRKDQLEKACLYFDKEIRDTWEFERSREERLGISQKPL